MGPGRLFPPPPDLTPPFPRGGPRPHFPPPIGLAAGFDKSGPATRALAGLGFGSIEIGSVSVDPSEGNPKPRLWRLPADKVIVVHYGFAHDGAGVIAAR